MRHRSISGSIKVTLVIAVFGIPWAVHAETSVEQKLDAPEAVAPPWELYDTDEDGYISMKEAAVQKMPPQVFQSLDIDRDGRLNKNEFTKVPPVREK